MPRILENRPREGNLTFSRRTNQTSPASGSHIGLWITLANPPPDMFLMHRLQAPPRDQALNRIQQFHPIFQRRVRNRLPLIEALFALVEIPLAADALGIDLKFIAFFRPAFPTDFSFWHRG